MELLLIFWSLVLTIWTGWLVISTIAYGRDRQRFHLEQIRWAHRCADERKRQQWN